MLFKHLLAGATIAVLSNAALADGPMAAQALFSHLARAGKHLRVTEQDAHVTRTLVRGMYAVVDAKGDFVTYVNEDGTLYGDKHGLFVFLKQGAAPRRMTADQLAAFRLEVVAAIDRDALIMVAYGNGGERGNTVLFSAVDCPACHDLEEDLGKPGRNEVLYVAPSSMMTTEGEGLAEWGKVAKVWCARHPGRAWRDFMASGAVPTHRQCAFSDPLVARGAWLNLFSILRNAGLTVAGMPGFVFEDGSVRIGANGARKQAAPSVVRANWLPSTYPPNPPMGLPADAFRPQPVKAARR